MDTKLTIACVKWGDKYGPEYVNILYERIKGHLSMPFSFVCATDDPVGLDDGIEAVPLPDGMDGWWNKLWLFSPEFQEICHERVFFFDLDTLVIDHIDELAGYGGEFIVLRDFYRPNGYGSGLMAWKRGFGAHIWENWNADGCPILYGGDQEYIEQQVSSADLWQDKYPGQVVSYKVHAEQWPPAGSKIVCFHGFPSPHECKNGWVPEFWKEGGPKQVKWDNDSINCGHDYQLENVKANIKRDLPWLEPEGLKSEQAVIVGGAPSLKDNLKHIRDRQKRGAKVFALNGTMETLLKAHIKPDYFVMMDARPENLRFVEKPVADVKYMINAMCHESVFKALEGHDVTIWHSTLLMHEEQVEVVSKVEKPTIIMGCGNTVGLTCLFLAFWMGFRNMHLYGMDSCYTDGKHHAYKQDLNDKEATFPVFANGKEYIAARWMMKQAQDFQDIYKNLVPKGVSIQAHGPGLLPDVCRHMNAVTKRMTMEKSHAI